jgi:hypothetical protein
MIFSEFQKKKTFSIFSWKLLIDNNTTESFKRDRGVTNRAKIRTTQQQQQQQQQDQK